MSYLCPHCGLNIVEPTVPLFGIDLGRFNRPDRGSLDRPVAEASIASTADVSIAPTAGEKEEGKSYLPSITVWNARSPKKQDGCAACAGGDLEGLL